MKTRKHFAFMLLLGLLLLAATGPGYAQTVDFVESDNLALGPPAQALNYFVSRDWRSCRQACAGDPRCKAYTFVKPSGYQAGDPPVCYLMSSLGSQVSHSCCITGLKRGAGGGNTSDGATSGFDIAGTWEDATEGWGASSWSFKPLGGNRYQAQQTGFGNASGTATLTGTRLRIDWTCCNGSAAGYWEYDLDPARWTAGKGVLVITKGPRPGTFKAEIRRISGASNGNPGGTGGASGGGGGGNTGWSGGGSGGFGGGCDISGTWQHTTEGVGSATWTFTPLGGGRYQAQERGLGNATGTALLRGNTLRIDWVAGQGAGFYEWKLGSNCASGNGVLTFTRAVSGTRRSFIERSGGGTTVGEGSSAGATCWALRLVWYGGGEDRGTLRLYRDGRATVQGGVYNGKAGRWKEANGQEIWLDMDNSNFASNLHFRFKRDGSKLMLFHSNYYANGNGSEATQIRCPAGQ